MKTESLLMVTDLSVPQVHTILSLINFGHSEMQVTVLPYSETTKHPACALFHSQFGKEVSVQYDDETMSVLSVRVEGYLVEYLDHMVETSWT